ncbi:MAG: TrgA family protein [Alphaproteobacteria bacterium]|nr:TrgA family protein [Alphaproteobacteria bacterium]
MPTAAKLIAAISFMILAWLISEQLKEVLPEGSALDLFAPINALVGLVMGWRIAGTRAGDGVTAAIGNGLTTVCSAFFWGILIWSAYDMFRRSVRGRYGSPMDAIADLFNQMVDYGALVVDPAVVATAVFGSVVCALIVEIANRKWP